MRSWCVRGVDGRRVCAGGGRAVVELGAGADGGRI